MLHIAHALWGGLLLFIAVLIPLALANRWAIQASALLGGIGIGLFIDEVGKFITQTNDYFYPAAAPIIYAFFLLTVLVYLQARKPKIHNARAELYRALDTITEVLDRDLEPHEFAALAARLRFVVQSDESEEFTRLAEELIDFISSDAIRIRIERPSALEVLSARWGLFEKKWLTQSRLKVILAGGLLALGLIAMLYLARLLAGARTPQLIENWLETWVQTGQLDEAGDLIWFFSRVGIEGTVGALLIISASLFIIGKDNWASTIAFFSLLLSLTVNNLIVFYFDQFSTILPAVVQLILLIGVLRYKRILLEGEADRHK
ncbi:MAG: hypothetical protein KAS36_06285 [Anaerolineales bacterium]|nr:hypothetical protein [Anaerolineales bacterium]